MTGWSDLAAELDAWADIEGGATFWWRDDDLTRPGPAYHRLMWLADHFTAPLLLAVIPARLAHDLAPRQFRHGDIAWYAQHGWAHENHAVAAAPGERVRKIELGGAIALDQLRGNLRRGRDRLQERFGAKLLPVMVPPWNRIAPAIAEALPELGYTGLSTFGRPIPVPGLTVVNTHVDVIDWRGSRGFAGEAEVLGQVVAHLAARRTGAVDRGEATGILTHHAVHDAATWAFLAGLFAQILSSPHAGWVSPSALFVGPRS